uniref:PLAT domain-containing protein n=1 Tax=Clytia hemisphaerica TaxID=252671 RepID=A0A7M5XFD6_9CNID
MKEAVERNKKIRGMLVDSLEGSITNTSSPSPAVASGLQQVTSQTELLSTDSLNKAVGITSTISSSLKHVEHFNQDTQDTVNTLLNTVGNLMNGQTKLQDKDNEEGNSTTSKQRKILESINNLVSSMDDIISVVATNQMVGQASTAGQTDAFDFSVEKLRVDDLGSQQVNRFKLPKTLSLNNTSDDVSTVQVNYEKNIFFSENSNYIGSKISSLSLQSNGDELEVANLEHPIEIKLENQEDLLPGETIEFFIPGFLVTHTVKLDSTACVLMLHIEPPDDLEKGTLLHILVQYAKAPTHDEHDFALTVDEYGDTKIILHDHHHHHEESEGVNSTNTQHEDHDEEEEKERGEKLLEHLYMVEHTVMIWDWHKFKYGAMNNSKVYFVMWYDGIIPYNTRTGNNYTYDILEDHHHYKYNFKSYCVTCTYWDVHTNSWETDGCAVVPEETDIQYTICHCNHLTAFSSMMVPPSPLPRMSFALLKEGYVLFVVVGVILGLYILFLIIFRKFDQIDADKIGGCLLPTNQDTDGHFYRITISTRSATTSKVFIKIYGARRNSRTVRLRDEHRQTFQSNGCDTFIMSAPRKLGEIISLKVYHDNSGGGWFVREIEVEDLETTKMYFFYPNRWLAVEKNDGRVSCNLLPTVEEELSKDTKYLFFTKLRRDLFDGHIWFSLVGRPPRSIFTRCQRLSVAVCMLLTSMIANVMFYGQLPKQSAAVENDSSNMAFSWKKLYIAVISSLVGIPVNVILNLLYRHIKPLPKVSDELKPFTDKYIDTKKKHLKEKKKERSKEKTQSALLYASIGPTLNTAILHNQDYTQCPQEDHYSEDDDQFNEDEATNEKETESLTEPKMLPYWCLYPTLLFNVLCILTSSFFIIWYGMAFGNTRSLEWLASVSFGLMQGIFITQPIKVLILAAFIAFVIKSIEREQKSILEEVFTRYVSHQISIRKQQQSQDVLNTDEDEVFEKNVPELPVHEKVLKPPSTTRLERQRQQRVLQLRLRKELIEIALMFLFTFSVYFLGYHLHDEDAFLQTQSIREMLKVSLRPMSKARYKKAAVDSFVAVGSKRDVFPFIENTVIHATYPHEWYANLSSVYDNETEIKYFPGNLYTEDLYTKIVSPLSIRQVRVHSKRCEDTVADYFGAGHLCYGQYGMMHQQKGDYHHEWNGTRSYSSSSEDDIMWRYRDSEETGSMMVQGELGIYLGGGYSVQLFPKQDNHEIIEHLLDDHWMNRGTRAILITFSVFNGGVKYFSSVSLLLEFPNSAGVIKQHSISTFKTIKYARTQTRVIITEFFTLLLILYYTFINLRKIFHQRFGYLGSFWNLVDFAMVVSSISSIVIHFYRSSIEARVLSHVAGRQPNESISFADVGFWGYGYTQSVACVNFFATIRLIRLLRLNRRTSLLEATLIKAKKFLYSYAIVFAIMMSGFIIFATMLFRTRIYEYRKLSSAAAAVIRLLLGKYSFSDYQEAHLLLGPLFFLIFNVTCNWIMINMLISILDDASHEVKQEREDFISQEAEAINYFLAQLKDMINGTRRQKQSKPETSAEKELPPLPDLDAVERKTSELELLCEQMLRDDYDLDRMMADSLVGVSPAISPDLPYLPGS